MRCWKKLSFKTSIVTKPGFLQFYVETKKVWRCIASFSSEQEHFTHGMYMTVLISSLDVKNRTNHVLWRNKYQSFQVQSISKQSFFQHRIWPAWQGKSYLHGIALPDFYIVSSFWYIKLKQARVPTFVWLFRDNATTAKGPRCHVTKEQIYVTRCRGSSAVAHPCKFPWLKTKFPGLDFFFNFPDFFSLTVTTMWQL